jgi:hypothetical protein
MEYIKEIKVLLSCTGELEHFLPIVDDILEEQNIFIERNHKMRFKLEHWKRDVYLGEGDPRPQDRLNERLVFGCDIFLGILWTRFGKPPGVREDGITYDSGTEEEFRIAQQLKKERWFFFCDIRINPSKIEPEQLRKVKDFKKSIQESEEYGDFSDETEFRKMLISNISNWFEKQRIIPTEDMAQDNQLPTIPTIEDFKKFNKGF